MCDLSALDCGPSADLIRGGGGGLVRWASGNGVAGQGARPSPLEPPRVSEGSSPTGRRTSQGQALEELGEVRTTGGGGGWDICTWLGDCVVLVLCI